MFHTNHPEALLHLAHERQADLRRAAGASRLRRDARQSRHRQRRAGPRR